MVKVINQVDTIDEDLKPVKEVTILIDIEQLQDIKNLYGELQMYSTVGLKIIQNLKEKE